MERVYTLAATLDPRYCKLILWGEALCSQSHRIASYVPLSMPYFFSQLVSV
jgi:hypothetical protein